MGLYKKHVPDRGLTWEQGRARGALLRLDRLRGAQRIDEDAVRQRWTPRKAGSNWSTINIAPSSGSRRGRMRPAGLAAYERRRADRSGVYAYENRDSSVREYAHGWPPTPRRRLLGARHGDLPQARRELGADGQAEATRDKRMAAAGRRLRCRTADPRPAVQHRGRRAASVSQRLVEEAQALRGRECWR